MHHDIRQRDDRLGTSIDVLGLRVDSCTSVDAVAGISRWMVEDGLRSSRTIAAANVHMVMEAWDDARFRDAVNAFDLVVPDGQPLVWVLRLQGARQRRRVRAAPDLVLRLFAAAESQGVQVGLYGGTEETLRVFRSHLVTRFPGLRLTFVYAPPFRPLTREEDRRVVGDIVASGTRLLLVGLGCPKQEWWISDHRDDLKCVMVGVGAAFDLLGGRTTDSPVWMRDMGLEWTWRLAHEPRRLWRRYALHNTRFVALVMAQLLADRLRRAAVSSRMPARRRR